MSSLAPRPWYRQFWPWALLCLPATAVVASLITFWIAYHSADAPVLGDYYKEGKAINRTLAREKTAKTLNLKATLRNDSNQVHLQITGDLPIFPTQLTMIFAHATLPERDRYYQFEHRDQGQYLSVGQLPSQGRWQIQLEDNNGDWRIAQHKQGDLSTLVLEAKHVGQ